MSITAQLKQQTLVDKLLSGIVQFNRLPTLLIALLAAFISFAIYILWPSFMYASDSLQAAMAVQRDTTGVFFYHPAGGAMFQPDWMDQIERSQTINARYFLDYPISVLTYRVWNALGYEGLAVTPILTLRAFAGALGVFFFVLAIFELTDQRLIAFLAGIGLGICASYWTFATDIYQTIALGALVSVSFYILIRQSKRDSPELRLNDKIILALILSLAVLYNILAVFTVFAFSIAVALTHSQSGWTNRLKHLVVFGVICTAVAGVLFVVAHTIIQPTEGQNNPFAWTDEESGISQDVFHFQPLQNAVRLFIGFTKSHVIFPAISVRNFNSFSAFWGASSTLQKVLVMGFYGAIGIIAALPVMLLYWNRQTLPANQRWLLIVLPIWFLAHAGFNWVYLPSDVHYWIVPMLIWWTAVSLCLSVIRIAIPRYYQAGLVIVGVYIVFMFGINFFSQFLPESKPENNPWLAIAETLSESEPNALFVSSGHPLDFHVTYFTHRNVVSAVLIALSVNGMEERISEIINRQVTAHRSDDGAIYLYTAGDDIADLAARVGVTEDDLEVAWEFPQLTIYQAVFR